MAAPTLRLALLALATLATGMHAGGLADHGFDASRSAAHVAAERGAQGLNRPTKAALNRGYRRSPPVLRQTSRPDTSRSLMDRALGEFVGYEMRDGLAMGASRLNRERYDSPRDRRVAAGQGARVGHYGTRIPAAIGRILSP